MKTSKIKFLAVNIPTILFWLGVAFDVVQTIQAALAEQNKTIPSDGK